MTILHILDHSVPVFSGYSFRSRSIVRFQQELGLRPPEVPSPLNLFMNIPVKDGKVLEFCPPVSRPGDRVALVAEMDCIVVFSACPQDILPINGIGRKPTEAHFVITSELNQACS